MNDIERLRKQSIKNREDYLNAIQMYHDLLKQSHKDFAETQTLRQELDRLRAEIEGLKRELADRNRVYEAEQQARGDR